MVSNYYYWTTRLSVELPSTARPPPGDLAFLFISRRLQFCSPICEIVPRNIHFIIVRRWHTLPDPIHQIARTSSPIWPVFSDARHIWRYLLSHHHRKLQRRRRRQFLLRSGFRFISAWHPRRGTVGSRLSGYFPFGLDSTAEFCLINRPKPIL